MARVLAILALSSAPLLTSGQLTGERDLTSYSFDHYLREFGRSYAPEELESRERTFAANMARILEHNRNPEKTWFAAPNHFTDWTIEEFKALRVSGRRPSSVPRAVGSPNAEGADPPESVDWRTKPGVLSPVKNQQQCGSCWAFAAVATLESHLALATGKPAPVLSEQQVVSCAPNPRHCGGTGGCGGATAWLAFNYTHTAGISLEESYPYQGVTGTCDAGRVRPVALNSGYVQLPTNDYGALLRASVLGPVAVSVAAGNLGWQLYGGGILSGNCSMVTDHVVQLVGYGSEGGQKYWIIRNSWGPTWGEAGFIRVARYGEGQEPCGQDTSPQEGSACDGQTQPITYCGLCGILSDSSYPLGVHVAPTARPGEELVV